MNSIIISVGVNIVVVFIHFSLLGKGEVVNLVERKVLSPAARFRVGFLQLT